MIHSDHDSSAKPNFDNFESLAARRKLRPVTKSKNICFKRSRGQLHINNLSTSMSPDLSKPGPYYNDPLEDSELKLALLNLIPRNTAQETSEGVQELIKHVSEFIGKKNPFKDVSSTGRKEKNEPVPPSSRHSIRSRVSKDTIRSIRKPKTTSGDKKVNKTAQSSAGKSIRDTEDSPKSESKSKSLSYANRKRTQIRKRLQPESKRESIDENEVRVQSIFKNSRNPSPKDDKEKNNPPTDRRTTKAGCRTESGKSSTTKKLKPSEIPLRKNRTNVSKVKQTSHVTMKVINEANVTTPAQAKSGASTNREIPHFVRDIDKENLESSANHPKDRLKTTDLGKCDADNSRDIHLSGSTRNSNIPELSNHPPKVRRLNLEQVRSSTFTVLTTLTNTLHRLESIHQQNVGLKENGSEKMLGSKSSKLKLLTPKSSFNLLKTKGSKKNLSSRLSSKGNKPSLKNKRKMSKTEVGTNRIPNFQENVKAGIRESSRGVQNVVKPIPSMSSFSTSRKQSLVRVKQNQKITPAKKIDGTICGASITPSRAISPKVAIPRSQVGTPTGFNQKLLVSLCQATSHKPEDNSKSLRKDPVVKDKNESSNRISPSYEGLRAVLTPIGRRKSDAGIIEGSTKRKTPLPVLIEGDDKNKEAEAFKSESKARTKPGDETKVKKTKVPVKELKLIGTAVKLPEVRTPKKPEDSESDKVQLRITIDVNSQEDCSFSGKNITEDGKNLCSFNWLFMNHKKYSQECEQQLNDTKKPEQQEVSTKKEMIKEPAPQPPLDDTIAESVKYELAVSKELEKHYRGSQMMKRRPRTKYKTPNKMNNANADTKLRSGLTRSFNRDVNIGSATRDHFDDINSEKLKRRNSEPFSFRGFIWRHQDAVPPRDNKASASSLGSSLKHLNTDDLEDFIFWESVPPRVTSCWETSLYHFKRPWSVLSCSVFKDNRLSNTPGLILENIRNGNSTTRRWPALQETERVSNSFDVEPSITQKNIDVRNWLAALNFQSPPSTSSDAVREGSVSPQTVPLSQEFKTPVVQKRRKIFPGLKLSESDEHKVSKDSDKFNSEGSDVGLMELIRRKSGGFVTAEQYFNSNRSQSHKKSSPRHKSKPKFQLLEDLEDSDVDKFTESEPHIPKEEKMVQVAFGDFVSPPPSRPPVEPLKNPSSGQDEEATPSQGSPPPTLRKFLLGDNELVTSNVWKYLFIFTLFVLVTYYVSRSKHSCRV